MEGEEEEGEEIIDLSFHWSNTFSYEQITSDNQIS